MDANEVIEAYVADVAARLPRRQRNDVAFELRALLAEELQDRAEAAGRAPDAAMAIEQANAFGEPADVAARYRPALVIIDPADSHRFLSFTVGGLLVLWALGLLSALRGPLGSFDDVLHLLGRWWGSALPGSLWWPGLMVVCFGLSAWTRRRWPKAPAWQPRSDDRLGGSRAALVLGVVGVLAGLAALANPPGLIDFVFGGRAPPTVLAAFTYTDGFMQLRGPLLLGLIALNVPLLAAVVIKGGWTPLLRRLETALAGATCGVMAWIVFAGPVFAAAATDRFFKGVLALVVALTLGKAAMRLFNRVRPRPR